MTDTNTPDESVPHDAAPSENDAPKTTDSTSNAEQNAEHGYVPATFLQFLSGMGAQTLMQLGKMANPYTGTTAPDLMQARYSIDLLGIFEEKTKNNRTPEEDEYMRVMLTNLRLAFVEVTQAEAQAFQKQMEEGQAKDSESSNTSDTVEQN